MKIPSLFSLIYTLSSSLIAFSFAWAVLYHTNFLYSVWHDVANIDENIQVYAPQNKHITDFELTNKQERERIFQEICHVIHQPSLPAILQRHHHAANNAQKIALENIHFNITTHDGLKTKVLLHEREIIHLLDVANMVTVLYGIVILNSALWLVCLLIHVKSQRTLPTIKQQLYSLFFVIALIIIIFIAIGPTNVFYWLHQAVFPDEHQWFFYYQDSLMSTMMAAPRLFGYIAFAWLIAFILIFFFIQLVTQRIMLKK